MEHAVEHLERSDQILLAGTAQPSPRLAHAGQWLAHVDDRCPTGRNRGRLRLDLSLMLLLCKALSPLRSPQRVEDQDVGRAGLGRIALAPEQVPPVGRTQRPWELHLYEPEQQAGRAGPRADRSRVSRRGGVGQRCPALIAYLLGAIGTTGSGIWLMRLISLIHWPGWRIVLIWFESFLLVPNRGVNET
jgi:hypothetical protein